MDNTEKVSKIRILFIVYVFSSIASNGNIKVSLLPWTGFYLPGSYRPIFTTFETFMAPYPIQSWKIRNTAFC
jgi:hypothetical protein